MSPCVQYNPEVTYESLKNNLQAIPEDHNINDRAAAVSLALAKKPMYTGLFYKVDRPTLTKKLNSVRDLAMLKRSGFENIEKEKQILKNISEQFK